jgi:hypothetical protein
MESNMGGSGSVLSPINDVVAARTLVAWNVCHEKGWINDESAASTLAACIVCHEIVWIDTVAARTAVANCGATPIVPFAASEELAERTEVALCKRAAVPSSDELAERTADTASRRVALATIEPAPLRTAVACCEIHD